MKNFLLLFTSILLLTAACERYEMEGVRTYRAAVESFDATRTTIGEGNKVIWSAEDQIAVFENSEYAGKFQITLSSAGRSSAEFALVEPGQSGMKLGSDVALYPYSQTAGCSLMSTGDYRVSGVSIPSVQQYAPNTFASGNFPMMAVSEAGSGEFSFRNACGILKLSFTGSVAVKTVTVKGNSGEKLSGDIRISMGRNENEPTVYMESDAGTEVSLNCGQDGVMLDPDTPVPFYIVLPPTDFAKGFTVLVRDVEGGEMEVRTDKANPVRRSAVLSMPAVEFKPSFETSLRVIIEPIALTFNELSVRVDVRNAHQYTGGYKLKDDFTLAGVLREANWKISPRISDSFLYEGPITGFPLGGESVSVSSGQTYVIWVAPYAEGQTRVTEDQIVYKEFTVPQLQAGGTVEVVSTGHQAAFKSMSVDVTAPEASVIYSALLTAEEYSSLASDPDRVDYLLANTQPVTGSEMTVVRSGLLPGTPLMLLSFAVDHEGRYGSILVEEYATSVPVYNEDLSIDFDITYEAKKAKVKIKATGGEIVEYYYYYSLSSASAWTRFLGGTLESAEEYLAINNDQYPVRNTTDDPFVDGALIINDLHAGEEYVVVIMAVDAQGRLSRAHMTTFVPQIDLGEFVYSTGAAADLWRQSLPSISFGACYDDTGFYIINWSVVPADGMTAYAVCAHPNTFEGYTDPKDMAVRVYNLGQEIVPGETYTMLYGDKGYMVYVTWCDQNGNFYETYSVPVPQS